MCLLAFALPAAESDRRKYQTLQAGLEARYRGAMRASGVLHVYRSDEISRATVIGQALDAAAVKDLLRLGFDAPQIASQPEDVVRSRPVSYTHLDVYKRQAVDREAGLGVVPGSGNSEVVDFETTAAQRFALECRRSAHIIDGYRHLTAAQTDRPSARQRDEQMA